MYASWHSAFALKNFAHLVCAVKSALLPVYPMPGAVDLSDGRDPPINSFISMCCILYRGGVPSIQYMISCPEGYGNIEFANLRTFL